MARVAPLRGTVLTYCHLPFSKVMIQKENYNLRVIDYQTFNRLYYELDDHRAALKEDCIEYVVYQPDMDLNEYPDWFIDVLEDGSLISEYDGHFVYIGDDDVITMTPWSVILRNFMGDLRYMERKQFDRYYEI